MNFDDMVVGGSIAYRLPDTILRCDLRLDGTRIYPFLFDQEDWGEQSAAIYSWAKDNELVSLGYRLQVEVWQQTVPSLFP